MKNTHNNRQLIRVLCKNADVRKPGEENCIFHCEEADCNIISHIKLLLNQHKNPGEVVYDDADTLHC